MSSKLTLAGVAALGVAAVSLTALPQPANAASARYCAGVAQEAVLNDQPRRGLLSTIVTLPFDLSGAVLTGYTSYDLREKRVYDAAYARCRGASTIIVRNDNNFSRYAAADDWMASCAARYRSFDPSTGTYVTYDGRVVACR